MKTVFKSDEIRVKTPSKDGYQSAGHANKEKEPQLNKALARILQLERELGDCLDHMERLSGNHVIYIRDARAVLNVKA
jgi:hypothetical protein